MNKIKLKDKKTIKSIAGFTLIEVLVSTVILASIALPMLNMFLAAYRNTIYSQTETTRIYEAQMLLEEARALTYSELMTLPTGRIAKDIDGDGDIDCYAQTIISPKGPHNDLATVNEPPSYMHIIFEGSDIMIMGEENTRATFSADDIDIKVDKNGKCKITIKRTGDKNQTLEFNKKSTTNDLIIIVNMNNKDYGNTYDIKRKGNEKDLIKIVQYSLSVNQDEVICKNDFDKSYIGINNYNTSIINIVANVYETDNEDSLVSTATSTVEVVHKG